MGGPSPWVRIKIGLDKNRRPLNKMSWKWTVQLNKTSIRWTSIRTVCMESLLQGSLWPLTSASHMTIHNPKSELWPVILPVNMPCSVYGDIFCFNPSIFSISVFSRLKFRFNSLFLSKLISFFRRPPVRIIFSLRQDYF